MRSRISESTEIIERLVALLTGEASGETQKMAASALVLLAQDEQGVAGLRGRGSHQIGKGGFHREGARGNQRAFFP